MRLSWPLKAQARTERHPLQLALWLSLWLATLGNLPLWRAMLRLPELQGIQGRAFVAGAALGLGAALFAVLSLLVGQRLLKPLGLLLLVGSAFAGYFMQTYGVVIDGDMLRNALQTDWHEVRDLWSTDLWWALTWGAVLPGAWLLHQRV